ncbi:NUDIX domain-containing protein [Nakamurella panacisegetis]|uniref:NUDIX domain-containing protein n=2 Tax=Nakamurella panacisegetis TaxID=1090615 RepID=A0A1H0KV39_9ACTN|nr:NUDIX domain-containing protein [Nakamurella panacisegetis]
MALDPTTTASMLDALPTPMVGSDLFPALAARLRSGEELLFKGTGPDHLTASYLVFDHDLDHVLLQFHARGRFWVQFGGHLEPSDRTFAEAATRELQEESGLSAVELASPDPFDLDRQTLSTNFGSCRTHFDLLYAGRAARSARPTINHESDAVDFPPPMMRAHSPGDRDDGVAGADHAWKSSRLSTGPGLPGAGRSAWGRGVDQCPAYRGRVDRPWEYLGCRYESTPDGWRSK